MNDMDPLIYFHGKEHDRTLARHRVALKAIAQDKNIMVVVLDVAMRVLFHLHSDSNVDDLDQSTYYDAALEGVGANGICPPQRRKKVMFVVDNPTFHDPRKCLADRTIAIGWWSLLVNHPLNPACQLTYTGHLQRTKKYRDLVQSLKQQHPELVIYDPTHLLCDTLKDSCGVSKNGKFLYSYSDHITDYMNGLIARELIPLIESLDAGRTSQERSYGQAGRSP